jgi:hypothetical protein
LRAQVSIYREPGNLQSVRSGVRGNLVWAEMRSKSLPAANVGRKSASVIGSRCLPSSDSGSLRAVSRNKVNPGLPRKKQPRAEKLFVWPKAEGATLPSAVCPNTKLPAPSLSVSLSFCAIRSSYSSHHLHSAGSLLPHPTLTYLINIFSKHLYSQYGRGPAAASGVAVDDSNCATVSENPRCHSRISALQGRRVNGPLTRPHYRRSLSWFSPSKAPSQSPPQITPLLSTSTIRATMR